MYKRVTSIVISFHLLFITLLLFNPHKIPAQRNNHVKVRTVRPMATVTSRPVVKKSPPKAPSSPAPTAKTNPTKKAAPATAAAKKPVAKTSNKPAVIEQGKPVKKTPPKKPEPTDEIWNEIDQALAKIEKKSYSTPKHSLDLPKPLIFVEESSFQEMGNPSAMQQLMGFLHETLHLPEVGEVKIEISVLKNGSVAKVVVLSSESKKNKEYLQKHLPLLQLPMQFEDEKNIIITFCNEV